MGSFNPRNLHLRYLRHLRIALKAAQSKYAQISAPFPSLLARLRDSASGGRPLHYLRVERRPQPHIPGSFVEAARQ